MLKRTYKRYFPMREDFGSIGENAFIEYPLIADTPGNIHIDKNTKIRSTCRIVNSPQEHVYIGKYSTIASDCLIATNNHRGTVGIPQVLLGSSHINDVSKDVVIEEDVWVGARVILLAGAHLSRGCVVGAGSIISSVVPPYSVVVGRGRIIARKFGKEGIKRHEEVLYSPKERMTDEAIDKLFEEHLNDVKTYGCEEPLSDKDKAAVEREKQIWKFIEPYSE